MSDQPTDQTSQDTPSDPSLEPMLRNINPASISKQILIAEYDRACAREEELIARITELTALSTQLQASLEYFTSPAVAERAHAERDRIIQGAEQGQQKRDAHGILLAGLVIAQITRLTGLELRKFVQTYDEYNHPSITFTSGDWKFRLVPRSYSLTMSSEKEGIKATSFQTDSTGITPNSLFAMMFVIWMADRKEVAETMLPQEVSGRLFAQPNPITLGEYLANSGYSGLYHGAKGGVSLSDLLQSARGGRSSGLFGEMSGDQPEQEPNI